MTQERGSGSVLAVAVVLAAAVAFTVVAVFGIGVAALHQARNAADLAALAGAGAMVTGDDACAAAATVAVRNRGELVDCRLQGDGVDVVVAVELTAATVLLPQRVEAAASARAG